MTSGVQIDIRLGKADDQAALAAFDEFQGDRGAEVAAGCLFVAVHQGDVVGYASYAPRGLLGQPLLTYLCVRQDHRRQGIALSLVRTIQTVARGRKLISSTEDWCTATQRIFERLGWKAVGSIGQINRDGSTEVFYAVDLSAQPPATPASG